MVSHFFGKRILVTFDHMRATFLLNYVLTIAICNFVIKLLVYCYYQEIFFKKVNFYNCHSARKKDPLLYSDKFAMKVEQQETEEKKAPLFARI